MSSKAEFKWQHYPFVYPICSPHQVAFEFINHSNQIWWKERSLKDRETYRKLINIHSWVEEKKV